MDNDLDINPLVSGEERMVALGIKAASAVLTVVVLGMVSCSMHSNAYEADVVNAEAKLEVEKSKTAEASAKVQIERIQAMERMVSSGANPIAIRCLDKGWDSRSGDYGVCLAAGLTARQNPADE